MIIICIFSILLSLSKSLWVLLIFSKKQFLVSLSLVSLVSCLFLLWFLLFPLLSLGLVCSSFSHFLRYKIRLLSWHLFKNMDVYIFSLCPSGRKLKDHLLRGESPQVHPEAGQFVSVKRTLLWGRLGAGGGRTGGAAGEGVLRSGGAPAGVGEAETMGGK